MSYLRTHVIFLLLLQSRIFLTDYIFVADLNNRYIYASNLSETGPTLFSEVDVNATMIRPVAVEYDPRQDFVFWSDVSLNNIHRAQYDGTDHVIIIEDVPVPDGLAIDLASSRIFWTDAGDDRIEVAFLNGTGRSTVVSDGLEKPRAIAADSLHGLLFWTDWGSNAKIERANMNGSNRLTVVATDLVWPNGMAIDPEGNKLYWCDASLQKLETSDLFGNFRETLLHGSSVGHPFDVAVHSGYLYWTDWRTENLKRINRYQVDDVIVERVGSEVFARAGGLHVYEVDECVSSPCQNAATCVDRIEMFVCACVDGYQGELCEIDARANGCSTQPCLNNATCISEGSAYRCACQDGYDGDNCQTAVSAVQSYTVCDRPPFSSDVTNDQLKDEYNVGEKIWFVCDSNKLMFGASSVVCGADGKWSGTAPYCIHSGVIIGLLIVFSICIIMLFLGVRYFFNRKKDDKKIDYSTTRSTQSKTDALVNDDTLHRSHDPGYPISDHFNPYFSDSNECLTHISAPVQSGVDFNQPPPHAVLSTFRNPIE